MALKRRDSLSNLEGDLDDLVRLADKIANMTEAELANIVKLAAEPVLPVARQMVLSNYRKAGIKRRTGKLDAAMNDLIVEPVLRDRNVTIQIRMPKEVSPYKNGSKFYTAAAAINYGAVRQEGGRTLGEKARRTLKSGALGSTLSKAQQLSQDRLGVTYGEDGIRVRGKKAIVIPPRPFFYLTTQQRKRLSDLLGREIEYLLIQKFGG